MKLAQGELFEEEKVYFPLMSQLLYFGQKGPLAKREEVSLEVKVLICYLRNLNHEFLERC